VIPVTYYRSSSISQWLKCPLRYYLDFNLGLKFPSGPAAQIGSCVHKILEILAECRMMELDSQSTKPYMYLDSETSYMVDFDSSFDINIDELCQHTYNYWIGTIDPARLPPSSKTVKAWMSYRKVKESVDNILNMKPRSFDPRNMNVIAPELKFDIELPYDWAKYDFTFRGQHYQGQLRLKGSIDLVIQDDDFQIEILDWKTGSSDNLETGERKTYEDYCNDIQLQLYYLVARQFLGLDVKYITIVFLNENLSYSVAFEEEEILDRLKSIYQEMQSCDKPIKKNTDACIKFCPYIKKTFADIQSKPRVKVRNCTFVNEVGMMEAKQYKICGQCNAYFDQSNLTPLQLMEILSRQNFNISEYVNT